MKKKVMKKISELEPGDRFLREGREWLVLLDQNYVRRAVSEESVPVVDLYDPRGPRLTGLLNRVEVEVEVEVETWPELEEGTLFRFHDESPSRATPCVRVAGGYRRVTNSLIIERLFSNTPVVRLEVVDVK